MKLRSLVGLVCAACALLAPAAAAAITDLAGNALALTPAPAPSETYILAASPFRDLAGNLLSLAPAPNPYETYILAASVVATAPGAPTIGTATVGNAQASVAFTAPASDGGSAITSYTITASPGGATATATAPSTSAIVIGLTNGTSYTFTVTATNAIGTGAASAASNAVTPATIPGAPTAVAASAGTTTTAAVTFTAPASNGGSAITGYTATSSPGGLTATGASSPLNIIGLTNGTSYTFTVTATNAVGTGAASTASSAITIDTTPPTLTAAAIASNNANPIWAKTGDTVVVTFTASEPVATPTATVAGRAATVALVSSNTYTATVTMQAADTEGTVAFALAFTDLTGNAGTAVTATTNASAVTFDRTAPAAPAITAITTDTGTSSTDLITSDATLLLSGTAEAGSAVTVTRIGAGILGTATANGAGVWSYDYTGTTLAAGDHSFTATAKDAAGNTSAVSTALIVTVDTATAAPVIASITTDTGASATDGITSDNTLTLAGTAEAGSVVMLTRSATPTALTLGTATANGAGAWSFVYATTLADGSYLFNASAIDAAGNTSAASADFPVVIDTAAPAAPVIAAIAADTGNSATDQITNDPTLVLSGTAEANAVVTVSRAGAGVLGTATANGAGAWSYDYTATTLPEGTHTFTATTADAAGNVSPASADFAVTTDPTTPTFTSAATATAPYRSAFTFTLTATDAGASGFRLFTATGLPTGLTLNPSTGAITGAPTQSGPFTVALTVADLAGNVASGTLTLTVDKVNLTVTGVVATNKIYDATLPAALTTTGAALVGVVSPDTVTLSTASATGAFATKTVAAAKSVQVAGLTLAGADAANYTLTQPTTTANITGRSLTVTGITAANKIYDGSTTATLATTAAALAGAVSPDAVTLVTSGAAGAFANANAATAKTVQVSGLSLAGTDAANYTITQPATVANITAASVQISIANLSFSYDGAAKSATVSITPNVAATTSYGGTSGGTAPIDAGSYTVSVNITDPNYSGSGAALLTIAKGTQTVAITAPATVTLGTAVAVSATASSGLSVTLNVSGPATLSGGQLTFSAPGTATVTATQAGDTNYNAASATAAITATGKLAQTLAFSAPADRLSTSGAFTLTATATSGLPVGFVIVSGPALLNDSTVTLTGAAGTVVVRASQPGDAIYSPALDVTASFRVTAATVNVFFGTVTTSGSAAKSGDVAATLQPNSKQGSLLVVAPAVGISTVLDFTLNADGTFTQTVVVDVPASVTNSDGRKIAAAPVTLTLRGSLINGRLQGVIEPLNLAFSANVLSVTGPSANSAGFYRSSTLANTNGATFSIVGTGNQVLVLARTTEVTTGGLTTLNADGTFGLQTQTAAGLATIRGAVDEPTTTVAGTISLPGKPDTSFAGLVSSTARTDRLINLSSRARIGSGASVLITGFVIGGTAPKQILVRGVGPALAGFGVQATLANPRLRLYRGSEIVAENDDWSTSDAAALAEAFGRVGAFALTAGSRDAALLLTLAPGAYTAHVFDSGATGVALAEIYDASLNPNSEYQRLLNISARGEVSAVEGVLIGGFVVTGNSPKRLLVRGVGPGLAAFGVAGTLVDPRLRVFSASTALAENDNWSAGAAADTTVLADAARATGAFALTAGSKDAAMILTLAPGAYTALVTSTDGSSTGVALIEIYEIPQ